MLNNIEKIIKKGEYLYCIVRDHPNRTKNDYVLHHRAVVENSLGRYLTEDEEVHHINQNDKHNNELDNLELISKHEHRLLHGNLLKKPLVDVTCPNCKVTHKIKPKNYAYHTRQGRVNFFCSHKCSGMYHSLLRSKP
jgi:hypothetical protein